MHEDRLGRRQMLRRAGVMTGGAAIASVGLASPALASGGHDGDRLEGSYMITRTDDGGPTDHLGLQPRRWWCAHQPGHRSTGHPFDGKLGCDRRWALHVDVLDGLPRR